MEIKDWVKYWRKQRQLTQMALAKNLDWSRDKLHRIEVGDRRDVNLEEILLLCEALKRPLDEVIELISKNSGREFNYVRRFLIEPSSSYLMLLDNIFGLKMTTFLSRLTDSFSEQYGFSYELGSSTKQYYSNVHATVMFLLHASKLLNQKYTKTLQDCMYYLRDNAPTAFCIKAANDRYAWDVTEGPSVFASSLACYALLMTGDQKVAELEKTIQWIISQRNDAAIWPIFKKDGRANFVSTFYTIMVLRLWQRRTSQSIIGPYSIQVIFDEVITFLEHSFIHEGNRCFVRSISQDEFCLSNTIVSLYILKLLGSSKFDAIFTDVKLTIDDKILHDDSWWISLLSDEKGEGKVKTMYTYNPAHLPLLLNMGWSVQEEVVAKMISWIFEDLRCEFDRKRLRYPWRSSNSVGQPFIYMFAIYSIFRWLEALVVSAVSAPKT